MGIGGRLASLLAGGRGRGSRFATDDVEIGRRVSFGDNVVFNSRRVRIGDGTVIGDNVTVDAETFEIGDYGTIYASCFFPGPGELRIGHNFWLGTGSIVDSQGGTRIGDNVGVGAHSQLWTHMKFGDVMAGCRFHAESPLVIEDDAWLVGHCLVSPVRIGARSVVMLGSVVTRDLAANRVYAGVPARDMTDKFGPPWQETTPEQRATWMRERVERFARLRKLDPAGLARVATSLAQTADGVTVFDVAGRRYAKRGTDVEHDLMRFLLPDAKFVPGD